MNKLICRNCGRELSKNDIILLVKAKGQRVVDVLTCCRGECHDELEAEKRSQGYSCGFYEINTALKDLILDDEFGLSLYEPDALKKYKAILEYCNS
ncbi:hypothetical protein [Clostridium sporogenes]|uniref:hypothetical protein n=1 Tax=Clostridium sporogenes TaxID=1509 RepID=UPI0001794E57|nr:hypothetical protein [Clostridium sporogenes]EDU36717.1 hypothetical protein CLOSPO_02886 [Clostridium sporogenes ATCC 15579]NFE65961.1 hypothetical protein [Clostridium sporogenes]